MKATWLKTRQTKYGAYVALYVLVVLGILTAGNYLADRYNKTYDATSNKIFSLSDQTKKVLKNLKTDVGILYFDQTNRFSESRFGPSPRDLLERYSNVSHRVKLEFVDPVRNPKKALDYKISSTGATIVEAGGRREEAKSLNEEQVTNALIRALKPDKRKACFLTGHGERDVGSSENSGYSTVKDSLEAGNFVTKTVSLMEQQTAVPSDCTVLVDAGPRTELLDLEIQALRKYVEAGGRAFFLLDPPTKGISNTALGKLLEEWGVKVNSDIVVDLSPIGQLFNVGPETPLVMSYESHPITQEMKNVASLFPLPRSVEPGESQPKVTVEKLFSTSKSSYEITDFTSGQLKLDPSKNRKGPFSLGVAGTVRGEKEGSQGRFVVAGSSRFASNGIIGFPGGNRDLFLNAMSWLSSDEDLISIRPKEAEDRRLSLSAAQMRRIFFTSVVGLPLFILAGGVLVWWRRR